MPNHSGDEFCSENIYLVPLENLFEFNIVVINTGPRFLHLVAMGKTLRGERNGHLE